MPIVSGSSKTATDVRPPAQLGTQDVGEPSTSGVALDRLRDLREHVAVDRGHHLFPAYACSPRLPPRPRRTARRRRAVLAGCPRRWVWVAPARRPSTASPTLEDVIVAEGERAQSHSRKRIAASSSPSSSSSSSSSLSSSSSYTASASCMRPRASRTKFRGTSTLVPAGARGMPPRASPARASPPKICAFAPHNPDTSLPRRAATAVRGAARRPAPSWPRRHPERRLQRVDGRRRRRRPRPSGALGRHRRRVTLASSSASAAARTHRGVVCFRCGVRPLHRAGPSDGGPARRLVVPAAAAAPSTDAAVAQTAPRCSASASKATACRATCSRWATRRAANRDRADRWWASTLAPADARPASFARSAAANVAAALRRLRARRAGLALRAQVRRGRSASSLRALSDGRRQRRRRQTTPPRTPRRLVEGATQRRKRGAQVLEPEIADFIADGPIRSCIQRSRRTCATAVCIAFAVSKAQTHRDAPPSPRLAWRRSPRQTIARGAATGAAPAASSAVAIRAHRRGRRHERQGPSSPTRSAKRAPWTMFIARSTAARCAAAHAPTDYRRRPPSTESRHSHDAGVRRRWPFVLPAFVPPR